MPRFDADPDIEDDLEGGLDEQDLLDTLRHEREEIGQALDGLIRELETREDIDPAEAAEFQDHLRERVAELAESIEQLALDAVDEDLARKLDEALESGGDLDPLRQELAAASDAARATLSNPVDPRAPLEVYDAGVYEHVMAHRQLDATEQGRALIEAHESSRRLAREIDRVAGELAKQIAAMDAVRAARARLEEAELAEHDEERKIRISKELTDGEVEF